MILEMMVTTCGLFRVLFVSLLGIKHQYCDVISPPLRDIYQPASFKTYSVIRGFSLAWLLALTEWLVCRIADFSRGVNKLTRRQESHANDSVNAKRIGFKTPDNKTPERNTNGCKTYGCKT